MCELLARLDALGSPQWAQACAPFTPGGAVGPGLHSMMAAASLPEGGGSPKGAASVSRRFSGSASAREEMSVKLGGMYVRRQTKVENLERANQEPISRCLHSRLFNGGMVVALCLNALVLAAQVHYEAVSDDPMPLFNVLEYLFTAIFTVELILRALAQRAAFCSIGERYWNAFDLIIVGCSWLDVCVTLTMGSNRYTAGSLLFGRFLRIVRAARVLRIIRTARFVSQLRVMMLLIAKSFSSLVWVFVVLSGILLIFSMVLTQGATAYLKVPGGPVPDDSERVTKFFGSLFKTMYSLAESITDGAPWSDVAQASWSLGWAYFCTMLFFVFFTTFSVLNVVLGVFVDGVIEMANSDRTMILQKKAQEKNACAEHLIALLVEIDTDRSGCISFEEFSNSLVRKDIRDSFEALEIDVSDAERLFSVLDQDGNCKVDAIEFVEGMRKLKGEAKSSDMQMLILDIIQVGRQCEHVRKLLKQISREGVPAMLGAQTTQVLAKQAPGRWGREDAGGEPLHSMMISLDEAFLPSERLCKKKAKQYDAACQTSLGDACGPDLQAKSHL